MFVGLDINKNYMQAAIMDEQGSIGREERIQSNVHDIEKFFANITDSKVVMEPSGIWYYIYKLLSKVPSCLNPIKTKAIASTKKDRW